MEIFRGEARREGTGAYKPKQKLRRLNRRRAMVNPAKWIPFTISSSSISLDRSRPTAGLEIRISRGTDKY